MSELFKQESETTETTLVILPPEVNELALKVSDEKRKEVNAVLNQIFAGTSDQAQAILDKERKEKEALEAQIKAKEEADKKRIADEKAKQEAEAKAKLDAEKKLAKASDKVKLTDWLNSINPKDFDATTLKDESGLVYNEIFAKFEGFKSWSLKQINSL